jgi:hypothetical protein
MRHLRVSVLAGKFMLFVLADEPRRDFSGLVYNKNSFLFCREEHLTSTFFNPCSTFLNAQTAVTVQHFPSTITISSL